MDSSGSKEDLYVLMYDVDLKAPACVLLQAVYGCGSSPSALRYFNSLHWLTSPTPGMRKIAGTAKQWQGAAKLTEEKWGNKRPSVESTRAE